MFMVPTSRGKSWNFLWTLDVHFKLIIFLWKVLNNALYCKSELEKRINSINPECALYQGVERDINHLFWECDLARAVWFGSRFGLRMLEATRVGYQVMKDEITELELELVIALWKFWGHRNKSKVQKVEF